MKNRPFKPFLQRGKQSLALVVSISLIATTGGLVEAVESAVRPSSSFDLRIPASLGYLDDTFKGSSPSPSKRVILIQDLHAHYGVQKNIAGILEVLALRLGKTDAETRGRGDTEKQQDVSPRPRVSASPRLPFALAVEGASGPLDYSVMALFPNQKIKQQAADYLMKEGMLSGAEYFGIVRGVPKLLTGVEDERYYDLHRKLFRQTYDKRASLVKSLQVIQKDLRKLRRVVYSKSLKKFQTRENAFQAGKLDAQEYLEGLAKEAKALGMEFQIPDLTQAENRARLWEDAETLAFTLKIQKAQTRQEKDLVQVERDLDFLIKVANLQATENEVRSFGPRLNAFIAICHSLLKSNGIRSLDQATIRELISSSIDYYAFALARNQPMVENTLALLEDTETRGHGDAGKTTSSHRVSASPRPRVAVLVAGGFHTRQITEMLRARNVAYSVITPHVNELNPADQDLYIKRLNGELLTEKEILAAAPQWPKIPTQLAGTVKGNPSTLAAGAKLATVGVFLTVTLVGTAEGAPHASHISQFIQSDLRTLTQYPEVQEWVKNIPALVTAVLGTGAVAMTVFSRRGSWDRIFDWAILHPINAIRNLSTENRIQRTLRYFDQDHHSQTFRKLWPTLRMPYEQFLRGKTDIETLMREVPADYRREMRWRFIAGYVAIVQYGLDEETANNLEAYLAELDLGRDLSMARTRIRRGNGVIPRMSLRRTKALIQAATKGHPLITQLYWMTGDSEKDVAAKLATQGVRLDGRVSLKTILHAIGSIWDSPTLLEATEVAGPQGEPVRIRLGFLGHQYLQFDRSSTSHGWSMVEVPHGETIKQAQPDAAARLRELAQKLTDEERVTFETQPLGNTQSVAGQPGKPNGFTPLGNAVAMAISAVALVVGSVLGAWGVNGLTPTLELNPWVGVTAGTAIFLGGVGLIPLLVFSRQNERVRQSRERMQQDREWLDQIAYIVTKSIFQDAPPDMDAIFKYLYGSITRADAVNQIVRGSDNHIFHPTAFSLLIAGRVAMENKIQSPEAIRVLYDYVRLGSPEDPGPYWQSRMRLPADQARLLFARARELHQMDPPDYLPVTSDPRHAGKLSVKSALVLVTLLAMGVGGSVVIALAQVGTIVSGAALVGVPSLLVAGIGFVAWLAIKDSQERTREQKTFFAGRPVAESYYEEHRNKKIDENLKHLRALSPVFGLLIIAAMFVPVALHAAAWIAFASVFTAFAVTIGAFWSGRHPHVEFDAVRPQPGEGRSNAGQSPERTGSSDDLRSVAARVKGRTQIFRLRFPFRDGSIYLSLPSVSEAQPVSVLTNMVVFQMTNIDRARLGGLKPYINGERVPYSAMVRSGDVLEFRSESGNVAEDHNDPLRMVPLVDGQYEPYGAVNLLGKTIDLFKGTELVDELLKKSRNPQYQIDPSVLGQLQSLVLVQQDGSLYEFTARMLALLKDQPDERGPDRGNPTFMILPMLGLSAQLEEPVERVAQPASGYLDGWISEEYAELARSLYERLLDGDLVVLSAAVLIATSIVGLVMGVKHLRKVRQFKAMSLSELQRELDSPKAGNQVLAIKNIVARKQQSIITSKLMEKLEKDSSDRVREVALKTLGKMRFAPAVDLMISIASNPEDALQREAIITLGLLKDKKAVEPLVVLLEEPEIHWEIQEKIIYALLRIGHPDGLARMGKLLENELIESIRTSSEGSTAVLNVLLDHYETVIGLKKESPILEALGDVFVRVKHPNAQRVLKRALELIDADEDTVTYTTTSWHEIGKIKIPITSEHERDADADETIEMSINDALSVKKKVRHRIEKMNDAKFEEMFGTYFTDHPEWLKESLEDSDVRLPTLLALGITPEELAEKTGLPPSIRSSTDLPSKQGPSGVAKALLLLAMVGLAGIGLSAQPAEIVEFTAEVTTRQDPTFLGSILRVLKLPAFIAGLYTYPYVRKQIKDAVLENDKYLLGLVLIGGVIGIFIFGFMRSMIPDPVLQIGALLGTFSSGVLFRFAISKPLVKPGDILKTVRDGLSEADLKALLLIDQMKRYLDSARVFLDRGQLDEASNALNRAKAMSMPAENEPPRFAEAVRMDLGYRLLLLQDELDRIKKTPFSQPGDRGSSESGQSFFGPMSWVGAALVGVGVIGGIVLYVQGALTLALVGFASIPVVIGLVLVSLPFLFERADRNAQASNVSDTALQRSTSRLPVTREVATPTVLDKVGEESPLRDGPAMRLVDAAVERFLTQLKARGLDFQVRKSNDSPLITVTLPGLAQSGKQFVVRITASHSVRGNVFDQLVVIYRPFDSEVKERKFGRDQFDILITKALKVIDTYRAQMPPNGDPIPVQGQQTDITLADVQRFLQEPFVGAIFFEGAEPSEHHILAHDLQRNPSRYESYRFQRLANGSIYISKFASPDKQGTDIGIGWKNTGPRTSGSAGESSDTAEADLRQILERNSFIQVIHQSFQQFEKPPLSLSELVDLFAKGATPIGELRQGRISLREVVRVLLENPAFKHFSYDRFAKKELIHLEIGSDAIWIKRNRKGWTVSSSWLGPRPSPVGYDSIKLEQAFHLSKPTWRTYLGVGEQDIPADEYVLPIPADAGLNPQEGQSGERGSSAAGQTSFGPLSWLGGALVGVGVIGGIVLYVQGALTLALVGLASIPVAIGLVLVSLPFLFERADRNAQASNVSDTALHESSDHSSIYAEGERLIAQLRGMLDQAESNIKRGRLDAASKFLTQAKAIFAQRQRTPPSMHLPEWTSLQASADELSAELERLKESTSQPGEEGGSAIKVTESDYEVLWNQVRTQNLDRYSAVLVFAAVREPVSLDLLMKFSGASQETWEALFQILNPVMQTTLNKDGNLYFLNQDFARFLNAKDPQGLKTAHGKIADFLLKSVFPDEAIDQPGERGPGHAGQSLPPAVFMLAGGILSLLGVSILVFITKGAVLSMPGVIGILFTIGGLLLGMMPILQTRRSQAVKEDQENLIQYISFGTGVPVDYVKRALSLESSLESRGAEVGQILKLIDKLAGGDNRFIQEVRTAYDSEKRPIQVVLIFRLNLTLQFNRQSSGGWSLTAAIQPPSETQVDTIARLQSLIQTLKSEDRLREIPELPWNSPIIEKARSMHRSGGMATLRASKHFGYTVAPLQIEEGERELSRAIFQQFLVGRIGFETAMHLLREWSHEDFFRKLFLATEASFVRSHTEYEAAKKVYAYLDSLHSGDPAQIERNRQEAISELNKGKKLELPAEKLLEETRQQYENLNASVPIPKSQTSLDQPGIRNPEAGLTYFGPMSWLGGALVGAGVIGGIVLYVQGALTFALVGFASIPVAIGLVLVSLPFLFERADRNAQISNVSDTALQSKQSQASQKGTPATTPEPELLTEAKQSLSEAAETIRAELGRLKIAYEEEKSEGDHPGFRFKFILVPGGAVLTLEISATLDKYIKTQLNQTVTLKSSIGKKPLYDQAPRGKNQIKDLTASVLKALQKALPQVPSDTASPDQLATVSRMPQERRTAIAQEVAGTRSPNGKIVVLSEYSGQNRFIQKQVLPMKGTVGQEGVWARLGVILGEPMLKDEPNPDQPLFRHVQLPTGWKILGRAENPYNSDLVDQNGEIRATIWHKLVHYDRRAHVYFPAHLMIREELTALLGDIPFEVEFKDQDSVAIMWNRRPENNQTNKFFISVGTHMTLDEALREILPSLKSSLLVGPHPEEHRRVSDRLLQLRATDQAKERKPDAGQALGEVVVRLLGGLALLGGATGLASLYTKGALILASGVTWGGIGLIAAGVGFIVFPSISNWFDARREKAAKEHAHQKKLIEVDVPEAVQAMKSAEAFAAPDADVDSATAHDLFETVKDLPARLGIQSAVRRSRRGFLDRITASA
jgi:hypothetical protein